MPRHPPPHLPAYPTPRAFEQFVTEMLRDRKQPITRYEVHHNQKVSTSDGEYQIDIIAGFRVMGVDFKVLCECKHMNRALHRDEVLAFAQKIRQLNAHKGIVFCTGGFQKGTISFARQQGIALVKVVEERFIYETKSAKDANGEKPEPEWIELYGVIPAANGLAPENDRTNWRTPEELRELLGLPG